MVRIVFRLERKVKTGKSWPVYTYWACSKQVDEDGFVQTRLACDAFDG